MRTRTAKILKGIAIILLVLVALYVVGVVVSSAKLHRAYAEIEKADRPMRAAEIIPPDVPDTEDAAPLYKSAILLLEAQPVPSGRAQDENLLDCLGDLSSTLLTESLDADKRVELEQLLKQDVVHHALSAVEQGTRRRSCRFEQDYEAGVEMVMPHLAGLRNLCRILGAKACIEVEAGRSDAAWQLVRTQLRFADALRGEPILISQLVRLASIRSSCQTIHRLCAIAPPSSEQFRAIDDLLSGWEDVAPLVLALDGERLFLGEWAFKTLKDESAIALLASTGQESELVGFLLRLYSRFKPLYLADHAAYLRIMNEHTRLLQSGTADGYTFDQTDDVERKIEQMHSRLHIVTAAIVPALSRVGQIYWARMAQVRVTRTGLALVQEKEATSAFPATLATLRPKQAGDPFSDGPLLYRPGPDGFVLYSIGPDQTDDGGSPRQQRQETGWDIVWKFPGGGSAEGPSAAD